MLPLLYKNLIIYIRGIQFDLAGLTKEQFQNLLTVISSMECAMSCTVFYKTSYAKVLTPRPQTLFGSQVVAEMWLVNLGHNGVGWPQI